MGKNYHVLIECKGRSFYGKEELHLSSTLKAMFTYPFISSWMETTKFTRHHNNSFYIVSPPAELNIRYETWETHSKKSFCLVWYETVVYIIYVLCIFLELLGIYEWDDIWIVLLIITVKYLLEPWSNQYFQWSKYTVGYHRKHNFKWSYILYIYWITRNCVLPSFN